MLLSKVRPAAPQKPAGPRLDRGLPQCQALTVEGVVHHQKPLTQKTGKTDKDGRKIDREDTLNPFGSN